MIFTDSVTKVPLGNDLGCHAKPLLFMSKASHEQPHGLWTVIDNRVYMILQIKRRGNTEEGVSIY